MEIKAKFGKYKAKEVDAFIAHLNLTHQEEIDALSEKITVLQNEISALKAVNEEHKKKETVIAQVMIDATQRAKDIEDDYRKRADESDAACQRLHDEWVSGMQSAAMNLQKMRTEAKSMLENIDSQFDTLCSWAGSRLDSLQGMSLPETSSQKSIENEIQEGAGADLSQLCKEMGLMEENEK